MFKKLTLMAALLGSVSLTAMESNEFAGGGFDPSTGFPTSFSNRPVEQVIPETTAQDTADVPAPAAAPAPLPAFEATSESGGDFLPSVFASVAAAPAPLPAFEAASQADVGSLPAAPEPAPALVGPGARSVASFLDLLFGGRPGDDNDGTRSTATSAAPTVGSTAAASDAQEASASRTYLLAIQNIKLAIPSDEYSAFKATLTRYMREAEIIQQSLAIMSLLRSLSGLAHAQTAESVPPTGAVDAAAAAVVAATDASEAASAPVQVTTTAPAPAPAVEGEEDDDMPDLVPDQEAAAEEEERSASPVRKPRSASMAAQPPLGDEEEGEAASDAETATTEAAAAPEATAIVDEELISA